MCPSGAHRISPGRANVGRVGFLYQLQQVTRVRAAVSPYPCMYVSMYLCTPVRLCFCTPDCTSVRMCLCNPVCTCVRMCFCTLVPLRLYSCSFVPRYPFPCTVYLYPCPPVTLFPYSVSLYLFTSTSTLAPLYPCPVPCTSDRCALLSLTTDQ